MILVTTLVVSQKDVKVYSDYHIKKVAHENTLSKKTIYELLGRPITNSLKTYSKYFKCSERDLRIATTAMACLESGNLKSKSMYVNNLFGIKRASGRPNFIIETSEYVNKKEVRLKQNFAVFFSIEDCVNGYYKFLLADRYKDVRNARNYKQYLKAIQSCGYATDPKYFEKAYNIALLIDKSIN